MIYFNNFGTIPALIKNPSDKLKNINVVAAYIIKPQGCDNMDTPK